MTDYRPFEGVTHDSLGLSWIPFHFFVVSLFFNQPVPNLVPNYPPAPLCNVSWGLSVCSVLVWSVSPCRLVLEVRLFPSPPALFCPLARRWCPLFSSSCLSGFTRLRPGVWCNIWTDVKLLLLQGSYGHLDCNGPTKTHPSCCKNVPAVLFSDRHGKGLSRGPLP